MMVIACPIIYLAAPLKPLIKPYSDLSKKQLNVQPTIKIRPGYRFNIVVLADMVLEPYDPRLQRLQDDDFETRR